MFIETSIIPLAEIIGGQHKASLIRIKAANPHQYPFWLILAGIVRTVEMLSKAETTMRTFDVPEAAALAAIFAGAASQRS